MSNLQYLREYSKKRYKERKEKDLCYKCGEPANGCTQCKSCQEKQNKRDADRRERRLLCNCCGSCGKEKEQKEKRLCNYCLNRQNIAKATRVQNRLETGLCQDCGKTSDRSRCVICLLKMLSTNIFGNTSKHNDLLNIFNLQSGLCPYTNRKLIIGENCELDHKVPRAKGGPDELDNLQWIYFSVNRMKHDLTESEFMELIDEIYSQRYRHGNCGRSV